MRRVFKLRKFDRWMRKTPLSDEALCKAVTETETGLVDADLGGGVLKKRVALPGRGKSAGVRTLIAMNRGNRWFYVFGFEKAERANITLTEAGALKVLATDLLGMTTNQLEGQLRIGELMEICRDEAESQEQDPGSRP